MGLRRYVIRRVLTTIPVLLGVSLMTFALVHLTPGDPIDQLVAFNPSVTPAEAAQLRRRYGLDGPLWRRYVGWLGGVFLGDFGRVVGSNRPVTGVIASRLPGTLVLGIAGWVIGLCLAIPLGTYAAINQGERGDTLSRLLALSGVSIPNFWLGLVFVLVFALWLDVVPILPPDAPLVSLATLGYLVLPAIVIGTASAATLTRILRRSLIEQLDAPYVRAARARGLPERTVCRHALRNSLLSVTTVAASLTASIITGAVVVETVFAWPGLGRTLVDAVVSREINLVLALTLLTAVVIVLVNLAADVLYAVLDPRIRYER